MADCRKVRFRDKVAALIALSRADLKAKRGNTNRRETRAYRCPHCAGWHLTSKEVRDA